MSTISTATGFSFENIEGISIVDSAIKAGLFFPYSCKNGRCKTCMCQLISGSTRLLNEEIGLSECEKKSGWILGCVRTPLSNLTISAPGVSKHPLPAVKTLPCRISKRELLSNDVIRIILRLPQDSYLHYYPGQYIDVIKGDIRRSYSIANAPQQNGLIELNIKRIEGGQMSEYWFDKAKPNDLLRINGPLGTFFLKDFQEKNLIFLATGTGFAPIKAMLENLSQVKQNERPISIRVYWGGRSEADFYTTKPDIGFPYAFKRVLSRCVRNNKLIYVQEACLAEVDEFTDTQVFACGSNSMIEDARSLFVKAGLDETDFYSDAFVCSAYSY